MTEHQRQLITAWERWEASEPDISTEQLMARVCAECNSDPETISDALWAAEEEKV